MTDVLHTSRMTVGYHHTPLIRDICLKLHRGQIMTLIGPNGAGKSTILKSITRQMDLLGGTVYLDGTSMADMTGKQIAGKMSVVLTERAAAEYMTCRDVVAMGRYPYTGLLGIPGRAGQEKVREALELVHGQELADRDFSRISDGERQRILLARAICQEPELIVLDEPVSYLDIRHKLEVLEILGELVRRRQVAVLMSLHELDLAQRISDYVVCVKGSTIWKAGPPEEIFTTGCIRELYGIGKGTYYAELGWTELEPVKGRPQVFVIGGGGSGIPVYRRLRNQGIPFAAGVLHEHDVEYPVARALAAEVVSEKAFEPVSEEALCRAAKILEGCSQVICTMERFGTMNAGNRRLAEMAARNRPGGI
ncbi:MAG: ABC transporter ATP-binding protein [Lachnospiraceae bacterium]|jgi:iron complex transport system ATP-binding protein|nr:ABC transporter ATP-binding protein [Lachnospiraceae bacterium]